MDSKELRNLQEAYAEVYAPQEEIDEAVKGEDSERRKDLAAERRAGIKPLPAKKGEEYAKYKMAQMAYSKRKREMDEELDIFDVVLEFLQAEGFAETLEQAEWMMANMIDEEAIGIILGEEQLDEVSDRLAKAARNTRERRYNASFGDGGMSRNYIKQNAKKDMLNKTLASRAARTGSKIKPVEEDYVNEAQHARENPDKYEREQAKKSAPVRGERTPMPPRGDKRREDFEKWYAKQMGR